MGRERSTNYVRDAPMSNGRDAEEAVGPVRPETKAEPEPIDLLMVLAFVRENFLALSGLAVVYGVVLATVPQSPS
jgi:hypothetical protein